MQNTTNPASPYCLVRKRASALMGATEAWVWLSIGKLSDTPGWSDRYLESIAASDEGCAVILRLLDKLEAGEPVPVQLIWEREPTSPSLLQLIKGRLYEVRGGKRSRVRLP